MIKRGTVVSLAYHLTDSEGSALDDADVSDPFTYLHGTGQIIPGLESAMEGLKVGDKRKLEIPAAQGYGEVDPNLKLTVPKSQFPPGAELEAGMRFQAEVGGEEILFTVESIEGDQVHIDGNHPLAGKILHFDVEVLSVRDATAEELEHGHHHDGDGHHHHDDDHDHDHDHDHHEEE